MKKTITTLILALLIMTPGATALAGQVVDLSAQSTGKKFEVNALIMEKKADCSEMVVAEERILIGTYRWKGEVRTTSFYEAPGSQEPKCRFRQGERVVVKGAILKDGSIMAFSIQRVDVSKR